MTLQQWRDNGWLRTHRTSKKEIRDLLSIVDRDLQDAGKGLSRDWRFGIAYNAALKLCTILLYAEGYRAERNLQHYRTIQAMPEILGEDKKGYAKYLDTCRSKRNTAEYEYVGVVTETEAEALISFTKDFKEEVVTWLKEQHPQLIDDRT